MTLNITWVFWLLLTAAVLLSLAGCASAPPPVAPVGLTRPAAWALAPCDPLPEIPKRDGDPEVRRAYYAAERPAYVECAAKHAALVRYVDVVAPRHR